MSKVLLHAQCGKKIEPLHYGEGQEYMGVKYKCPMCGLFLESGQDIYVHRESIAVQAWINLGKPELPELLPNLRDLEPPKMNDWSKMLTDETTTKTLLKGLVKELSPILPSILDKMASESMQKVVTEMATEAFRKAGQPIQIQIGELPPSPAGQFHKRFPLLLRALVAGTNPWLAGPSGSGKTTAAMQAAAALQTSFRYTGAVSDAYGLLGFRDANGQTVRTPFREAWENGGVFLWDEIDASDPNALLCFNAALANGTCAFPDATIPKHGQCRLIAAANTWGHGATHEYVGRNKIDAAFLKRFAFISWPYDEELEMATATNKDWCDRVQQVRKSVQTQKIRVLVTPRETYTGERLLAAGCSLAETDEMTIRSGMSDEQWAKVQPLPKPGHTDRFSGLGDIQIDKNGRPRRDLGSGRNHSPGSDGGR